MIQRSPSQKNAPPPFRRKNSLAISLESACDGVFFNSMGISAGDEEMIKI